MLRILIRPSWDSNDILTFRNFSSVHKLFPLSEDLNIKIIFWIRYCWTVNKCSTVHSSESRFKHVNNILNSIDFFMSLNVLFLHFIPLNEEWNVWMIFCIRQVVEIVIYVFKCLIWKVEEGGREETFQHCNVFFEFDKCWNVYWCWNVSI